MLFAGTRRAPVLGRALLQLALDDRMPEAVRRHWVVDALLHQQPPDRPLRVRRLGVRIFIPPAFVDIYVRRAWEPMTSRHLMRRLRPGMTFVDVGAHLGHYTLLAARAVGRSGRVIALEPGEQTFPLLSATVRANGLDHVTVHAIAAGRSEGRRVFYLAGNSQYQGLYRRAAAEGGPLTRTTVEVQPLDAVVRGPVDVVKIDVEGAELDVLAGMSRILSENPGLTLVVEWNPRCLTGAGARPEDLPATLETLGFKDLTVLDAGHGRLAADRPLAVEDALAALHADRLPRDWYGNLWAARSPVAR